MTDTPRDGGRTVEDDPVFRIVRLCLLLTAIRPAHPAGVTAERLAGYAFLAADPLAMLPGEDGPRGGPSEVDQSPDRLRLVLAGFDDRTLAAASRAHRLVTIRQQLPADLVRMIAHGLAECQVDGRLLYQATPSGTALADQVTARYAAAYRTAAGLVAARLRRMSERGLRQRLVEWTIDPSPRLDPADLVAHPSEADPAEDLP